MAKEIHKTTCTMDCPDTCTLDVTVENKRIIKIDGNKDNPVTNGFICSKVSKFTERLYHKDLILYPMRRVGKKGDGEFERISWEEAVEIITEKFKSVINEHGGESILPYHYGGSNGMLGDDFIDDYFFSKISASRIAKTLCARPTSLVNEGMFGKMPGVAFDDYPHARFILIWGANPKASNIHLVPFLKQAKKNGAFIAVVDPVNNFSDSEINLHLPVKPGTDLPVALSIINYLNEKNYIDWAFVKANGIRWEKLTTEAAKWRPQKAANAAGIETEAIIQLAEKYVKTNPAILRCGWGLERNRNGGQAVAAVMALPALLNKYGLKGGGHTMSNSGAVKFDKTKIFTDFNWNTRILNMTQLDKILNETLDPPIKAMFVYNCNPVATVPNQNKVIVGLKREDLFTVVHDQVFTDTTKYADIALPAVTFLEQYEVKKGYGNYIIGDVSPVIAAQGERKPNEDVFFMMANAMQLVGEGFNYTTSSLKKEVKNQLNVQYEKVSHIKFEDENPVQFVNVFPRTTDGKINFCPDVLGLNAFQFKEEDNNHFPLQLISPANNKMISSTFGEFNYPEMFATINKRDAEKLEISSDDTIKLSNELGEVVCQAKVSEKIKEGVVSIPKGAWRKSSVNGFTSTALCPSTVSDVGGGACYNDARVSIEKLEN